MVGGPGDDGLIGTIEKEVIAGDRLFVTAGATDIFGENDSIMGLDGNELLAGDAVSAGIVTMRKDAALV